MELSQRAKSYLFLLSVIKAVYELFVASKAWGVVHSWGESMVAEEEGEEGDHGHHLPPELGHLNMFIQGRVHCRGRVR